MKLQIHRDSAGDLRARGRGRAKVVAGFLESDVQDSPDSAREILRALEKAEAGQEKPWERTGNAYTLTVTSKGAILQDEMADDSKPCAMTLAELRQAVSDWLIQVDA